MTGLDKIISQIQNDAKTAAEEILADAEREAKTILSQAEAEGEKITQEISDESARNVTELDQRSRSAALLQKKKNVLAAKQAIIDDMIHEAQERLAKIDDKTYFETVVKIAEKNARAQTGEIVFSEADLARLPKDFEKTLNAVLTRGGKLTVSKQTQDIDGGFLLDYGGIEVNCSFKAMFDSARETLQDKVREYLFS